ncbi:MAG: substrate-binding domain-containing protein [Clostridia bacterium]|nr:substrate-binding domain-containing protein [Clostridia bacterium]
MKAYILIQTGNASTHWTSLFLRGITDEAKAKGWETVMAESDGATLPDSHLDASCVLAIGSSFDWTVSVTRMLRSMNKKPILVGCANQNGLIASGYSVADYERATESLLDYYYANGRRRVALFGINNDSPADLLKMKAFLRYDSRFTYNDIFFFRGQTKNVCESLVPLASNYDAVISANDVAALMLMQTLENAGIRVPEDIFVSGFGDITYRKNINSRLTVATLDCVKAGRSAVDIYSKICKDPSLSYITVKMSCEIDVRESTASIPYEPRIAPPASPANDKFDLFADMHLTDIMLAEKILADCDALDIEILRGINAGMRNADVAEMLHASESTVKYRIKRLVNLGSFASRTELLGIMASYLK